MKKVIFIGSKELGFNVFRKLYQLEENALRACITFDDQNDSRTCFKKFGQYCKKHNIPFYVLDKPKEINKVILDLQPDLCFVLGWYFLIDAEIIDSVPMGFIGIHNSILPNYRGFAPLVWTMINRDKRAGFSIFNFSKELDAGKIWATGEVEIEEKDYIKDVIKKINKSILEVLEEKYLQILDNKITPYNQLEIEPSYCAKRMPEDGIINWQMSDEKVYNFIRAQSYPYPGAYTLYKNKRLIVWKAELYNYKYYGIPGQVGQVFKENGVLIICGDSHCIILKDIEYDGKQMNASNILNSLTIRL